MNFIKVVLITLLLNNIYTVTFSEAIENLRKLETYIKKYKKSSNSKESLNHLILSYIREGKYTGFAWSTAAGNSPSGLAKYIIKLDAEKKTKVAACRKYGDIVLPTKEKMDFVHLFAVMNGINYSNSYTEKYSALVGWAGDTAQLFQDIQKYNGTLAQLLEHANKYLGIKGQFGEGDLVADLDAPIILKKKKDNNTFADIIEKYYNGDEWKKRVPNFVKLTFPNAKNTTIRQIVYSRYTKDSYIRVLECKYHLRVGGRILGCLNPHGLVPKYRDHQKAAVYAFADYLKKRM